MHDTDEIEDNKKVLFWLHYINTIPDLSAKSVLYVLTQALTKTENRSAGTA